MSDFPEIYIAYVSWGSGGKTRPVLVWGDDGTTIRVYAITTKYESKSKAIKAFYYRIKDWRAAGLERQSYISTSRIITLDKSATQNRKPIGALTERDQIQLIEFVNKSKR
jgi:hypothetical protein